MSKSITEGLFPSVAGLFATPGLEQQQMLQQARQPVSDPLAVVGGDIRFLQERGRQGLQRAFGQMPEQDRKRQVFQQLVRNMQQQGVDISTPQGMIQLAQQMSSIPGLEGEALNLRQRAAQMAQQAQMQGLEANVKQSQIIKNLAAADKDRTEKEPMVKTSEKFARVGQGIGIPIKPNLAEYSLEETALINSKLEKMAKDEAEASAAKLSLAGQQNVLGIDAKDAEDYRMQRNASIKQLKALNNMERLLGQGVITGSMQEARTGFLRALDTLGVSTDKAKAVVGNTEQFDKEVRQLLLGIIKTLGYNPSNADVRFAMDSLPSLTTSATGLQEIVKRFIKANTDTLEESERALSYFRTNKGSFEGFTPNIDIYSPKQITVKDLSDEELQKRLAAARAAKQPK